MFLSPCPGGKQRGPVQTWPEAEERSPGNNPLSLVKFPPLIGQNTEYSPLICQISPSHWSPSHWSKHKTLNSPLLLVKTPNTLSLVKTLNTLSLVKTLNTPLSLAKTNNTVVSGDWIRRPRLR